MVLDFWETGDVIAQIPANNRGIRKGTTSDLDGIGASERELGVYTFNTTDVMPQVIVDHSNNLRSNTQMLLGADSTEMSVTGVTATQVKDLDFIISDDGLGGPNMGFAGNRINIVALLKTDNAGNNANLRIRFDASPTDELVLSTNTTGYSRLQGTIDIGPGDVNLTRTATTANHTLKAFLDDGSGETATLGLFEVYGL
jgi:hypothetical protein